MYNRLTVTSNNTRSPVAFLPLFCNCQLNSIPLLDSLLLSLSLMLRPTVSRPVCLGLKHPSGAYDQICIIAWQLRVCWFGAPSLMRGRVCRLQLLLALASAVIFWSESHRTRGHILLSQIRDFPFRRLLRLAGSRWRYSTPPPHRGSILLNWALLYNHFARTMQKTPPLYCWEGVFTVQLHSNGSYSRLLLAYSLPRECVYRIVA
jgi:hypothetical protein